MLEPSRFDAIWPASPGQTKNPPLARGFSVHFERDPGKEVSPPREGGDEIRLRSP